MDIHPKWGKKFECFSCGCKFYDLNKPKAVCPKCGADQADEHLEEELLEVEEEEEEIEIDDDEENSGGDDDDDELPAMEEELGYDESEPDVDEADNNN